MTDPFENVPVVLAKLTGRVRGFCTIGSDWEPIIVINEALSPAQRRKTYLHELDHIRRGDMSNAAYREYD